MARCTAVHHHSCIIDEICASKPASSGCNESSTDDHEAQVVRRGPAPDACARMVVSCTASFVTRCAIMCCSLKKFVNCRMLRKKNETSTACAKTLADTSWPHKNSAVHRRCRRSCKKWYNRTTRSSFAPGEQLCVQSPWLATCAKNKGTVSFQVSKMLMPAACITGVA